MNNLSAEEFAKEVALEIMQPNNRSVSDKAQRLQEKQFNKIQNLSDTDLTESFTKLSDGSMLNNNNKIYNSASPLELQKTFSDTISNYQLFKDENTGNLYRLDENNNKIPYSGETARFYMYGIKDNPDAIKIGITRGDISSSDLRYDPVKAKEYGLTDYGWESNDVNLTDKRLDILLPKDQAIVLEALIHGNNNALDHRLYGKGINTDLAKQHGSGYTEVYDSVTGALGDTTGKDLTIPVENLIEKYIPKDVLELTPEEEAAYAEYKLYQDGSKIGDLIKGAGLGLFRFGADTVKLGTDLLGRGAYEAAKAVGFDEKTANLIGDKVAFIKAKKLDEIESSLAPQTKERIAAITQQTNEKVDEAFKDVDITKPSTYKNIKLDKLGEAFSIAFDNTGSTGYSLGYVLPLLFGGAVKSLVSKGFNKETSEYLAAKAIAKESKTKLKNKKLTDAQRSVLEKNLKDSVKVINETTSVNKLKGFIAENASSLHLGALTNAQALDEYIDNYGERVAITHVLLGLAANTVGAKLDLASDKLALLGTEKGVAEIIKSLGKEKATKFLSGLGAGTARLIEGGIVEAPTEFIQQAIQTYTATYKDGNGEEAFRKALDEGLKASVQAAASGIHMATPRAVGDLVPNTAITKNGVQSKTSDDFSVEDIDNTVNKINSFLNSDSAKIFTEVVDKKVEDSKDILSDEGRAVIYKTLADHINTLKKAEEVLKADPNINDETQQRLEKVQDAILKARLFTNKYIRTDNTPPLFNRPLQQVEGEIKTTQEKLNKIQDDSEKAILDSELKRLKTEQYLLKHFPQLVNTEYSKLSKFDKTLHDKLFGKKDSDGLIQYGIVDYVKVLTDPTIPDTEKTIFQDKLKSFIESQYYKTDAFIRASKEWRKKATQILKDNGIEVSKIEDIVNHPLIKKLDPKVEFKRDNNTFWSFHRNSYKQLANEVKEYKILRDIANRLLETESNNYSTIEQPKNSSTDQPSIKNIDTIKNGTNTDTIKTDTSTDKVEEHLKIISDILLTKNKKIKAAFKKKGITENDLTQLQSVKDILNLIDKIIDPEYKPKNSSKSVKARLFYIKEKLKTYTDEPAKTVEKEKTVKIEKTVAESEQKNTNTAIKKETVKTAKITSESEQKSTGTIEKEEIAKTEKDIDIADSIIDFKKIILTSNGTIRAAFKNIISKEEIIAVTSKEKLIAAINKIIGLKYVPRKNSKSAKAELFYIKQRLQGSIPSNQKIDGIEINNEVSENDQIFNTVQNTESKDTTDIEQNDNKKKDSKSNDFVTKLKNTYGEDIVNIYERLPNAIKKDINLGKLKWVQSYVFYKPGELVLNKLKNIEYFKPRGSISNSNISEIKRFTDITIDKFFEVDTKSNTKLQLFPLLVRQDEYKDLIKPIATIHKLIDIFLNSDKIDIPFSKNTHVYDIFREDVTSKGYSSISKLLIKNNNGKLELPLEVKNALALSILNWLALGAVNNSAAARTDSIIKKMLNLDTNARISKKQYERIHKVDGFATPESEHIGNNVLQLLGIKGKNTDDTVSEIHNAKLKTELGLLGLIILDLGNTLKLQYKHKTDKDIKRHRYSSLELFGAESDTDPITYTLNNSEGKRFSSIYDKIKIGTITISPKKLHKAVTLLSELVDHKKVLGVYTRKFDAHAPKEKIVNTGITGKVSNVSKFHESAVKKQSHTPYKLSKPYFDLVSSYTKNEKGKHKILKLAKLLGYKDVKDYHISQHPTIKGKNNAILRDINHLIDAYNSFKLEETPMYLKWGVTTNNRFIARTNQFDWHTKKLHRHAVYAKKIELNSKHLKENFFLALGQSFGVKIGKLSRKTALKESQNIINKISKMDVEEALEFLVIEKGEEATHAMYGLGELYAYLHHKKVNPNKPFKTGIRIETDATTSGYILRLLQFPVLSLKTLYEELARGGITNTKMFKYKSFGHRNELKDTDGNKLYKDSYEEPASMLEKELKKTVATGNDKAIITALINLVNNSSDIIDIIITRSIIKNPFMILNYGAGLNRIVKNIIENAIYGSSTVGTLGYGQLLTEIATTDDKQKIENNKKLLINIAKIIDAPNQTLQIISTLDQKSKSEILTLELFTDADLKKLENIFYKTLKPALQKVFSQKYGPLIKVVESINDMVISHFTVGKYKLDKKIQKYVNEEREKLSKKFPNIPKDRLLPKPPSQELITKWISEDLRIYFPIYDTALPTKEGNPASIFIAQFSKQLKSQYDQFNTDNTGIIKTLDKNGKTTSALYAPIHLYEIDSHDSAGGVLFTHFIDASIQAILLSKIDALGIHDANYFDLDKVVEGTKLYNKLTYEINKNYSVSKSILDNYSKMLDSLSEEDVKNINYKLLEKRLKRYYEVSIIEQPYTGKTLKDINEFVKTHLENAEAIQEFYSYDLKTLFSKFYGIHLKSEKHRKDIFSNPDLRIEHAYFEGADFKPSNPKYTELPIKMTDKVKSSFLDEDVVNNTRFDLGIIDTDIDYKSNTKLLNDIIKKRNNC